MAAGTIRLRVLTRDGIALDEEAVSIIAPGELGYVGILRRHAPLAAVLGSGRLTWRRPGGERRAVQLARGLLDVLRDEVTILTDAVTQPRPAAPERPA
jgi:F-type H+-transporting ATPase subunit epsilon